MNIQLSIAKYNRSGIKKGLRTNQQASKVYGIGVNAPLISDRSVSSSFANSVIILNLAPKATPIWTKAPIFGCASHMDLFTASPELNSCLIGLTLNVTQLKELAGAIRNSGTIATTRLKGA